MEKNKANSDYKRNEMTLPFLPPHLQALKGNDIIKNRVCQKCQKVFLSQGRCNRTCEKCIDKCSRSPSAPNKYKIIFLRSHKVTY